MENKPEETKTEISITSVPAKVTANFDEIRTAVENHLSKFKGLVIGSDSIQSGKNMIKEINKTKNELNNRRKEAVAAVSAPIKDFDEKMKELIKLHDDAKTEISEQIAHHEAKIKERIRVMLQETLETAWETNAVAEEFRNASVDDLVLLGSMTPGGKLKGNINGELHIRADRDKALQQQTELRLARLEADSYKAGLSAPLARGHVEQFLFDDDATYAEKLEALFAAEVEREKIAIDTHRKRQEQVSNQQAAQASEGVAETTRVKRIFAKSSSDFQPTTTPENDQYIAVVTATFNIPVASHVPIEAVVNAVTKRLQDADFTTLTNVSAEQQNPAA